MPLHIADPNRRGGEFEMKDCSAGNASVETTTLHPVTAYDVARLAGVSQSAVSRAFTVGSSISPRMRLKVEEAARRLNYRPNLIARSLSMRHSNTVGVIVPPMGNAFFPELLEDLSAAFNRLGYRVLLFTSSPSISSDPILEDVLYSRVDAVVMVSTSVSSRFAEECQRIGLPIILLNRKTNGKGISSVTGANVRGAETVASFLVAGKHSRYAFMAGLESSSTSRDREMAFTRRLGELGKKLNARVNGNFSFEDSMKASRELFSVQSPSDAIFCANDYMAFAAIQVARKEFGLEVGRDVSIVGFDDSKPAAWPMFDLTTYVQPSKTMAETTADLLHAQLRAKGKLPATEVVIPGELIVRGSARRPRRGLSGPPGRLTWSD
jgi:DNA-binding LacI/PurR family transcriptional regulator